MNIVSTRFGIVHCSEAETIHIPEGLVGFRSCTRYVLIPDQEVSGLSWLQSTTAPELAFALVAPPLAVSDYKIELRPGDRAALELDDERSALIYVILNRVDGGGLTVNLQGPLVFNMAKRIGRQLVLTSSRYSVRYPLGMGADHSAASGHSHPSSHAHAYHGHASINGSSTANGGAHASGHHQNRAEPAVLAGAGVGS